jgi:hypothetical protein
MVGLGVLWVGDSGSAPDRPDPKWFACASDYNCRIVQDATCALTPINREYAQRFTEWVLFAHPNKLRADCPQRAIRYAAHCEAERCASRVQPGAARSETPRSSPSTDRR